MNEFMDDENYDINSISEPLEFAMGGSVESMHLSPYTPTNQESGDFQDAHSMPMTYAHGGAVHKPRRARAMLQKFADGGLVQSGLGSPFDLTPFGSTPAAGAANTPEAIFRASSPYSQKQIFVPGPMDNVQQQTDDMLRQKLQMEPTAQQSSYWGGIFNQDKQITPNEVEQLDQAIKNAGNTPGAYTPTVPGNIQMQDVFGPMSMMTGGADKKGQWTAPVVTTRPAQLQTYQPGLSASQQLARDLSAQDKITGEIQNQLSGLYASELNRSPDRAGMDYWTKKFSADGKLTDAEIAEWKKATQDEKLNPPPGTQDAYSGDVAGATEYLKNLYQKELKREADAAGLDFWINRIGADGVITAAELAEWRRAASRETPTTPGTDTGGTGGGTTGGGTTGGGTTGGGTTGGGTATNPFQGDVAGAKAYLQQLYLNELKRPADTAGLDFWMKEIGADGIITAEELARWRAKAQEESAGGGGTTTGGGGGTTTGGGGGTTTGGGGGTTVTNPFQGDAAGAKAYLQQLYLNELKRPADSKGLKYWMKQIGSDGVITAEELASWRAAAQAELNNPPTTGGTTTGGTTTGGTTTNTGGTATGNQTNNAYSGTTKGVNSFLQDLYQSELGREADTAGLNYWMKEIGSDGVITQDELKKWQAGAAKEKSARSQLNALYESVLGRAADTAGMEYWLKQAGADGVIDKDEEAAFRAAAQGELSAVKKAKGGLIKKDDGGEGLAPVQEFSKGGLVYRADGSPEYGEIAIGGGVTPDTKKALSTNQSLNSTEALKLLRRVYGEGASNLESTLRGSIAAIPGAVGDIESLFRDSDKTRKFATTEEVLRDYMPKRMTTPTKEGKGFEEVGSYLPLPIPAGTVSKGVQTVGRAGERLAERNVPRIMERGGKGAKMLEAFAQNTASNVVKPKGGNWLEGSFEDVLKQVRTAPDISTDMVREAAGRDLWSEYASPNNPLRTISFGEWTKTFYPDVYTKIQKPEGLAINKWIDTKFAKYLKNEMGTPEDPVRALAERGILHVDPDNLTYGRHTPFTNQLGQSNAARQWETATDYAINVRSRKDISDLVERGGGTFQDRATAKSIGEKNPWLSKLSPDTPVYSEFYGRSDANNLGFTHLFDELRSALDPTTDLPQNLRWTPKDLEKVTVPQAVERVAQINDWRAKQALEAEKAGMMGNLQASPRRTNENFSVSFVDKPGGTWVDVPETVNDKNVNFCTSIGKAGGWCTMEAWRAKDYGSGENRLTALLDAEGRPHLQAMITTRPITTWDDVTDTVGPTRANILWREYTGNVREDTLADFIKRKGIEAKPTITELKPPENSLNSARVKQYVDRDPEYRRKVTEAAVDFLNSGEWGRVNDLGIFNIVDLNDKFLLAAYLKNIVGSDSKAAKAEDVFNAAMDANPNPPRFMTPSQLREFVQEGMPPVEMSKGGIVKKAAAMLKDLGVKEEKIASKELTTLQDAHTSLGDSVRARAAKMQQQMDAMEFKYKPGQRVFTEDSAKKNKSPYIIKAKRMTGNIPMREPHPEHPWMGKLIKDPKTGRAQRTPYEPGYLIREENGPDDWAEYVLPESAIKGSVDEFAKGGAVKKSATLDFIKKANARL